MSAHSYNKDGEAMSRHHRGPEDIHVVHEMHVTFEDVTRKPAPNMGFRVAIYEHHKGRHKMPLEVDATTTQFGTVTLDPKTPSGKKARVDGAPTWAVQSGTATVEPAADGMSAKIYNREAGESIIGVSADADLGQGVETISDTITWRSTSEKASSLGLPASVTLEELPEAAPGG